MTKKLMYIISARRSYIKCGATEHFKLTVILDKNQ